MRKKYEIHHRKMFALIFLHRFRSNEMLDVRCLGAKRRWLPIGCFYGFLIALNIPLKFNGVINGKRKIIFSNYELFNA